MKHFAILGLILVWMTGPVGEVGAQIGNPVQMLFPPQGNDRALADKIRSCNLVVKEFLASEGLPSQMIDEAKAVMIFPNTVRAGFILSGQYGHGVALFRNDSGQWSAPAFFRISGVGFGFQAGGEVGDHILVIRSQAGVEALLRHRFTLGLDIGASAGPAGRNLDVATNSKTDVLTYGRTRGLYAGVSLDGAVIKQDTVANNRFYGKPLDARGILMEGKAFPTQPGTELIQTLNG